jgi:hypothetical protein
VLESLSRPRDPRAHSDSDLHAALSFMRVLTETAEKAFVTTIRLMLLIGFVPLLGGGIAPCQQSLKLPEATRAARMESRTKVWHERIPKASHYVGHPQLPYR